MLWRLGHISSKSPCPKIFLFVYIVLDKFYLYIGNPIVSPSYPLWRGVGGLFCSIYIFLNSWLMSSPFFYILVAKSQWWSTIEFLHFDSVLCRYWFCKFNLVFDLFGVLFYTSCSFCVSFFLWYVYEFGQHTST